MDHTFHYWGQKNHCDYYNRKDYYSVILHGVCNDRYEFIDINVGWRGRVDVARVYQNSPIFQMGEEGKLFNR